MLAAASMNVAAADLRVSRLEDALPEGNFDLVVSALRCTTSTAQVRRTCLPASPAGSGRGTVVLGDVVVSDDPADVVTPIDGGYDQPSTVDD